MSSYTSMEEYLEVEMARRPILLGVFRKFKGRDRRRIKREMRKAELIERSLFGSHDRRAS
ncbi:hypothetical protein DNX69_00035 [Rhodopseudomonas palustris]|uniref:Uncharacterized protein n=1 Tax=Rhodopseudomonas palustris TaxID=1076 RepID=A0A323UQB3_RHOPL|nr:hypothetical protein [Rhodopseudomonas palustris]PZA13870.1 hypothetical protein DNX69_00035 [Rhodopseudomonas palustris]